MIFIQHYDSPLGGILLAADEIGMRGLWFDGQKYFARDLPAAHTERNTPVLREAGRWLDIYFTGREPDFRQTAITANIAAIEIIFVTTKSTFVTSIRSFVITPSPVRSEELS